MGRNAQKTKAPDANQSSADKKKSGEEAAVPTAYFDVSSLPRGVQKNVRKWLIEGAPFEDVVERVAEPGEVTITQRAVEHYFRSKPELQAKRIQRQMDTADKLAKTLRNPKSAKAKLAMSVLVMGLSGLNRRDQASGVKHAMQVMKEQKDERFKEADAKRKTTKMGIEKKESKVRVQSLHTKLELATLQLGRLKQSIENQGKDKSLGPEILQQINEIYGLVAVENSVTSTGEAHDE